MAVDAAGSTPPLRRRGGLRLNLTTPALLGLPLAWLGVFFLVPIAIVAAYSFDVYSLDPVPHSFTLSAWHAFLHSSIYLSLFWKSVKLSLIVSAIIVLAAFPLAYYLALSGTKRKYVLLLLLIAPFLTSYLLRVLAWKVILGDQGVINSFLFWTGLRSPDHPISQLLYSRFAVMLVLGGPDELPHLQRHQCRQRALALLQHLGGATDDAGAFFHLPSLPPLERRRSRPHRGR